MANKPVDPKLNRKNVKFTVGSQEYQIKMANSRTSGSLFALAGYTDLGENVDENAIALSLQDAMDNGLLIKVSCSCQIGNRSVSRSFYVPTPKIEEVFKNGKGKTIGTAKVVKIRTPRRRIFQ